MNFESCLFPLKHKITYSRAVAYARGDDDAIGVLETLYWVLNNAYGVVRIAGVTYSEFPWRETPLEEFIF